MKGNLPVPDYRRSLKKMNNLPEEACGFVRYLRHSQHWEQVSNPAGETILLAEDDKFVRTLMRTVLYHAGYTVIEAIDGEEAVIKFLDHHRKVDVLVIDLQMYRKKGKEIIGQIRQMKPSVKVILASGYPEEFMRERGIINGDVHLLLKPFDRRHLLKKIREVLDDASSNRIPVSNMR